MKPPARMLEDSTLPDELRRDVELAVSEPETYDVAAGDARLAAALALNMPPAPGDSLTNAARESLAPAAGANAGAGSAGAGVLGSAAGKLGIAAAAAGLVALGAVAWPESPAPGSRSGAEHAGRARATDTRGAAPAAPLDLRARAPVQAAAPTAPALQPAAPRPLAPDADAEQRREIAQLGRIKMLLEKGAAARAYALAQAGHRTFARGILREEREALAVLALFRLQRRPEAIRRARAFIEGYPQSAHREEIANRLGSEQGDAADP